MQREAVASGSRQLHVIVSGLKGGRSGDVSYASSQYAHFLSDKCTRLTLTDMRRSQHRRWAGKCNRLLATTVVALLEANSQAQLVSIAGGDKRNALAREASAVLTVSILCGPKGSIIKWLVEHGVRHPSCLEHNKIGHEDRTSMAQVPEAAMPSVHEIVAKQQADFVANMACQRRRCACSRMWAMLRTGRR